MALYLCEAGELASVRLLAARRAKVGCCPYCARATHGRFWRKPSPKCPRVFTVETLRSLGPSSSCGFSRRNVALGSGFRRSLQDAGLGLRAGSGRLRFALAPTHSRFARAAGYLSLRGDATLSAPRTPLPSEPAPVNPPVGATSTSLRMGTA